MRTNNQKKIKEQGQTENKTGGRHDAADKQTNKQRTLTRFEARKKERKIRGGKKKTLIQTIQGKIDVLDVIVTRRKKTTTW